METLEGLGKIARLFSGVMTVKSEADYWNSHSDSYKATVIVQAFFGFLLAMAAYWSYMNNPVGTVNSTVPVLLLFDYLCICWALNSQRSLREKSFRSENFSEFWKFGFFKGDDFMGGVIFGWLLAGICTFGIFSSLVLHQTVPITVGGITPAPAVVHTTPAPVIHQGAKRDHHSAHQSPAVHHNSVSVHSHTAAVN